MRIALLISLIAFFALSGCSKEFLEKKPNDNIVVPKSLKDIQAILDNENAVNHAISLGELSTDQYYVTDNFYSTTMNDVERNFYTWAKDVYMGQLNVPDWTIPYKQILYANVALEALERYNNHLSGETAFKNLKGAALFHRAWSHFNLAQVFAPPFDSATADSQLGIPWKSTADVNEKVIRPTLGDNYKKILSDLTEAAELLSASFEHNNRNRPSRATAYAMLARVYLNMRSYENAMKYCDLALNVHSSLIDYNTLPSTQNPFTRLNDEVIIQANLTGSSFINLVRAFAGISIDTILYKSYDSNDLRKSVFFTISNGFIKPKPGYTGDANIFAGLATNELFLIKAECLARSGFVDESMEVLNQLLVNRYTTGKLIPRQAVSPEEALGIVLEERRKELVFRGVRWMDVRRQNMEGRNIVMQRQVAGQTYELQPNSPRCVLPIPDDVIGFSGIQQNNR